MADVTLSLSAKDVGVAATLQRIQGKLAAFQASMSRVGSVASRINGSFAGLRNSVVGLTAAYIGVSQAIASFNKALEIGGRLKDLSETTGEAAGNLMLLEKAFELSGAGAEKVKIALSGMARFINELSQGNKSATQTANELGISLADLEGKTPIEQLRVFLEAIGNVTDANKRLVLSMEVFKKVGKDLIPLAMDFGGAMDTAAKQLGSAPAILTQYANKLDEVGENMQAISEKGSQFFIGFIAGAKGIDDATRALSEFDAAAAGFDFGKIISGAFQAPADAFVALVEILHEGTLRAGNALANAVVYAGKVYAEMFADPRLYKLIGSNLMNAVVAAASTFGRMMLEITQTIVSVLSKIPGMQMIDPLGLVSKGIQAAQDKLGKTASDAAAELFSSMQQGSELMSDAAPRVNDSFRPQDYFGAAAQGQEAQAAIDRLRQRGTAPGASMLPGTGAETATEGAKGYQEQRDQLDDVYLQESDRLRQLGLATDEYREKMELLNRQYDEALRAVERARAAGSQPEGIKPPAEQMDQATLSETVREAVATGSESTNNLMEQLVEAARNGASEESVRQAVQQLQELNGKLPQSALVE